MVGHTGYLVFARAVERDPDEPAEDYGTNGADDEP